ncbi:hypothetical protein [Methylobacterium goesingense]|uniref:Uncharacterized protein n=1 Tax=Methylobacterium goesingense TaxID=243690 RepID=A0ABV2LBK1_9HYPH|nr:hypothetical protein [Methylobacterium goesingense]GJD76522.1 hypothetical protein CFIICLFH_4780 [Methylobacterium goesingense]
MIKNIPAADAMEESALQLYFLAWHQIMQVLDDLRSSELFQFEIKDGQTISSGPMSDEFNEFIERSQPELRLGYTLVQQSQEIGLKSKICAISPFLLLSGTDVRHWAREDADFTDLRTLDASDLVRVYNAIQPKPLKLEFTTMYEFIRGNRNKIYHLGSFDDKLDPAALISVLINQYRELYPHRRWIKDKLSYQSNHRMQIFYDDFNEYTEVLLDLKHLTPYLTKAQHKVIYGFEKSKRKYICWKCCDIACLREIGGEEQSCKTAILANKNNITCSVCEADYAVERIKCEAGDCLGNVIGTNEDEEKICLTCYHNQADGA